MFDELHEAGQGVCERAALGLPRGAEEEETSLHVEVGSCRTRLRLSSWLERPELWHNSHSGRPNHTQMKLFLHARRAAAHRAQKESNCQVIPGFGQILPPPPVPNPPPSRSRSPSPSAGGSDLCPEGRATDFAPESVCLLWRVVWCPADACKPLLERKLHGVDSVQTC